MTIIFAATIGVLYAAGFYMIMQRSIVNMVIALILLSHASNFLIFISGGLKRGSSPVISSMDEVSRMVPDPLPQALVLTAIVISFGMLAFALILSFKTYVVIGTDDSDTMKEDTE